MDFDTGSSDLILPSIYCDSSCSGHETYDPSASFTSRDLNKTFELTYGDNSSTKGEQYTDDVIISGLIVRGGIFLVVRLRRAFILLTVRQILRLSGAQLRILASKAAGSLQMA